MDETLGLIATDAARAFGGAPTSRCLIPGDLATWELRGRLVASPGEEPRIDIDGGTRIDRADGDATWIVGASPGAGGSSWTELSGRLVAALRAEFSAAEISAARAAAAWAARGRPLDETRIEIRAQVSVRARGPGGTPGTHALKGSELRLRWREPTGPRSATLLLEEGAPEPPPPARQSAGTFARIQRGDYRVILAPEASAYLLHELAHAALERGDSPAKDQGVAGRGGPALVEDPAAAPYPYGFDTDDLGRPAACSTLWSSAGRHALPEGHARRSSLAATPRSALSCTRLVDAPRVPLLGDGLSLHAHAVSAARYDPALDRILLALLRLDTVDAEGYVRPGAGGVLSVAAEDAWQGLAEVDGEGPHRLVQARCTRLGCVHPVMVGAPTIALRSMHFEPEFPRQQREIG